MISVLEVILNDIRQIIVVSDLHCGCKLGLYPPNPPFKLDDAVTPEPSPLQFKMWQWWLYFWDEWVPKMTRKEVFAVVVNGDTTDGRHHNTVTQVSQNLSDQRKIAISILKDIVDRCEGHFYMTRGTEAHTGSSGENEETLAEQLGAIPDESGRYARWELILRIEDKLAHICHTIGTTSSNAYETTALKKEYEEANADAAKWGNPPYDVMIRSHRHRFAEIKTATSRGDGIFCVTPGWQLKTPLTYKMVLGRTTTPQVGGVLWRVGDEEHFTRHFVRNLMRTPEVVL
jgi:hypothetical protein